MVAGKFLRRDDVEQQLAVVLLPATKTSQVVGAVKAAVCSIANHHEAWICARASIFLKLQSGTQVLVQ